MAFNKNSYPAGKVLGERRVVVHAALSHQKMEMGKARLHLKKILSILG